jgi:hypothetical protein
MKNSIRFFVLSCVLFGSTSLLYGQQSTFSKVFNGIDGGVQAYSIVESYDHNYLIAGVKDYKGLILKISTEGNLLWARTFNNPGTCFYEIIRTTDSCYVLVGKQEGSANYNDIICLKLNQNEDTLWSKRIDLGVESEAFSVAENDDQGYILTGYSNNDSYPYYPAIFVGRLSSNGDLVWIVKNLGDNFFNNGYSARQVPDGGFIVTGFAENSSFNSCACLLKLLADGSVDWFKKLELPNGEPSYGYDVQIVPDGFFCYFPTHFDNKLLIMKTDFSGDIIFSKLFEGITGLDASLVNIVKPKLHPVSDGGFISVTPGQGGNLIKIDSEGYVTEEVNLVLIPTDVIEMTDKGFIILGNGPLIGSDKDFNPQIGIIRTDSLGQGTECVYPSNYYQESGTAVFTNLSTSGTSGGSIASIYPEISVISLYSEEGCVDVTGSVGEIKLNTLMVYPNPANEYVEFELTSPIIPPQGGSCTVIKISDVLGEEVAKLPFINEKTIWDCREVENGIYFYIVEIDGKRFAGKVVKEGK